MKDHEEFSTLSAAERRVLIIAELKRKSRIRTLLRGLPLDEVREIIDRMKGVLNELEEEYKKREEEEKEKRAQAERIMSDMESCGVDIGLLNEMFTSKSEPDNAKYSKDVARMLSRGWELSSWSATVSHRRSKKMSAAKFGRSSSGPKCHSLLKHTLSPHHHAFLVLCRTDIQRTFFD